MHGPLRMNQTKLDAERRQLLRRDVGRNRAVAGLDRLAQRSRNAENLGRLHVGVEGDEIAALDQATEVDVRAGKMALDRTNFVHESLVEVGIGTIDRRAQDRYG